MGGSEEVGGRCNRKIVKSEDEERRVKEMLRNKNEVQRSKNKVQRSKNEILRGSNEIPVECGDQV